jgi:hypothetical protein
MGTFGGTAKAADAGPNCPDRLLGFDLHQKDCPKAVFFDFAGLLLPGV